MREDGEAPSDGEEADEGDDSDAESDDASDSSDSGGGRSGGRREGKSRDEYEEVTTATPPAMLHRYARGWQAYIVAVAR